MFYVSCNVGTPQEPSYKVAIEKGDYETALKELRPLAEKGDANGQCYLARMYAEGLGVPQNN